VTYVDTDLEVAKAAIYLRGLFLNRYAAVEFATAEIVSRAFLHASYEHLGHPPFGPTKKARRLLQLVDMIGPIAPYGPELKSRLEEISHYADYRNFMAHALMVPTSKQEIAFRMYDHREGIYSVGDLEFEMEHFETLADLFGKISLEYIDLIGRICTGIPLPELH
jgi:hypothetical protein